LATALAEQRQRDEASLAEERQRDEAAKKKRDAEEAQRRAQSREASYAEYWRKTDDFFDALLRTNSDLEVGVSYLEFGNRVRDTNFKYNKWVDSLAPGEKLNLSARLMEVVLNQYITSQSDWKNRLGEERGPYWYSKIMMQWRWHVASITIAIIKDCKKTQDILPSQPCPLCIGAGSVPCPWCHGTAKCPLCKGVGSRFGICCLAGNCEACGHKGSLPCSICMGTGRLGS
jgi:hypothetical protein